MAGLKPATRKKRSPRSDSESTPPLAFIKTMQPMLVKAPPNGGEWLHEIKYDGNRTQLIIQGGAVRAFTRNGHDWTGKYGPIVRDARALPCTTAIIDGEVCVQDEHGVTDFPALRAAMTREPHRLAFFAFDLLHLDGEDLRQAPLEERRAKLRWLLRGAPGRLHLSDEFNGDGAAFFKLVDKMGLEGIVSKKKGSRYVSGESRDWHKIKCWHTDTYEVVGVEKDAAGIPYALLADHSGYRGSAFVSLPGALRTEFWRFVEEHKGPARVSIAKPKAMWIKPGLRATVRHLKGSEKLRHATVTGIDVDDP